MEGIYKVNADLADALDKGLDDFRNKKLFDFGFSDPSKLEVNGTAYTKSGDKWMAGPKTMDNTVRAEPDRQAARPERHEVCRGGRRDSRCSTATVTSNDSKRVEKVTIRKQGDKYFAQRENEPSIYELDAQAVNGPAKGGVGCEGSRAASPSEEEIGYNRPLINADER